VQGAPGSQQVLCGLYDSLAFFAVKFFLTTEFAENTRKDAKQEKPAFKLHRYREYKCVFSKTILRYNQQDSYSCQAKLRP
jgi:hypothetical protein